MYANFSDLVFQVLICSDCMTLDHKQHVCERVTDVGARLKNEIIQISEEAKKSVQVLKEFSESLSTLLDDVALARDNNRSSIEEAFQSYKAILLEVKVSFQSKLSQNNLS